ncbi:hypothetical protein T02_7559 [Trichinella nativa]|uniref:Uncharacterized protein n=1 Tax=Trichinella nativa TaxID=6335 RepID=A0A0V1LGY5_9BILA|nr:hypothetical protein T02_7559 [Trichinella nativa]
MYTPDGPALGVPLSSSSSATSVLMSDFSEALSRRQLTNRFFPRTPGARTVEEKWTPTGAISVAALIEAESSASEPWAGALHPVAPLVFHSLKLLAAWFVCSSDDGGGSPRQAEGADLVDQDSAGSSLDGALFADIQNTTRVSGHIAIVPARRVRRIAGNSQQDGFRSTPRSFRLDPLVWWPS